MRYSITTQQGATMIEVLVTTVVLALGILGTSALQITSIKGTDSAHYRTVATLIANDMAERMRTNGDGVASGDYETAAVNCNSTPDGYIDCAGSVCTPSQLASYDIFQLSCGFVKKSGGTIVAKSGGIENSLPNGSMTVSCGAIGCSAGVEHTITISWLERADENDSNTTANLGLTITP